MDQFTYKNFTYIGMYDQDEDKYWTEHYVQDPTGNLSRLDFSQYCDMNASSFKALVDLNFPIRPNQSIPWTPEDLEYRVYTLDYTIYNNSLTEL